MDEQPVIAAGGWAKQSAIAARGDIVDIPDGPPWPPCWLETKLGGSGAVSGPPATEKEVYGHRQGAAGRVVVVGYLHLLGYI